MGRIVASVTVGSLTGSKESIRLDARVDTGASHLTLPTAWRDRLGEMLMTRPVRLETATQSTVGSEVCGPVKIEVEGFPAISGEVLFMDMDPEDGTDSPIADELVAAGVSRKSIVLGFQPPEARRFTQFAVA